MLMSFGGVIVRKLRMPVRFVVVALLVVLGCRVVCLGGVLVVLGCFAMRFVCHKSPLIPGRFPSTRLNLRSNT
jgi:hypothetical protein